MNFQPEIDHGYLKGKIRMKKVEDESVFVVKTLKLTDEEGAQSIIQRKEDGSPVPPAI